MIYMETDRLYLRPFKPDDAEAALAWLGDPEAMRYIEPVFDLEKTKDFLTACVHLVFCLCLQETGSPIGHVIWHPYKKQSDVYELGWILAQQHWGRGYAKEISLALIEQARKEGIRLVVLEAIPENRGSIALIESLDAQYVRMEDGLVVYELEL